MINGVAVWVMSYTAARHAGNKLPYAYSKTFYSGNETKINAWSYTYINIILASRHELLVRFQSTKLHLYKESVCIRLTCL